MASRLLLLVTLALGGCGDFVEPTGDRALVTLGSDGGSVQFREMRLEVPAGALTRYVSFEVSAAPGSHVSDDYHLGPADLAFAVPVSIAIRYDHGSDGPASDLYVLDVAHDLLHPLPGRVVEATVIKAEIRGAGRFALVRCPAGMCGR